jgi:hypothetical protein
VAPLVDTITPSPLDWVDAGMMAWWASPEEQGRLDYVSLYFLFLLLFLSFLLFFSIPIFKFQIF